MRKPWSITTTLRNPERLIGFLSAVKELEGVTWNEENQEKFQILLIQKRLYGLTPQFLSNLSLDNRKIFESAEPLTFDQAKKIFYDHNYESPAMRGRQSLNPLKKMGFVVVKNGKLEITSLGKYLLEDEYTFGEVLFRSFLKWQLPNPTSDDFGENDGFNIKPFVATLHLINQVNIKWESLGNARKGLSKHEFSVFVPTLIDYKFIDDVANAVIELRNLCKGKRDQEQKEIREKYEHLYISKFLQTEDMDLINGTLKNCRDYGDNILRYFRITQFFHIRGKGTHVDLQPTRKIEIELILSTDNACPVSYANSENYLEYLSDVTLPILPWEETKYLKEVVIELEKSIRNVQFDLGNKGITFSQYTEVGWGSYEKIELERYINKLRTYLVDLQRLDVKFISQKESVIEEYIQELKDIYRSRNKPSIELERLSNLALTALNDAVQIKPNYPVGDDNEPTFTAPAGKPDIECYYEKFNAVCEVTMLRDRNQWFNEGQPVMRHVRDFENANPEKKVYCVFVAPALHADTTETFWTSVKHGYKGSRQYIVPITIDQLVSLLETLLLLKRSGKKLLHTDLQNLYDQIILITENESSSDAWVERIPERIREWANSVV